MKTAAAKILFLCWCLTATVYGQGMPFPDVQQQQFGDIGLPNAAGFVCTYAAGTTTPLATYSDITLTTNAHNPIQLNAAGRPVIWAGSTEIEIYAQARSYKVVVHAAGTGSTCNGTSVGAAISTRDNIPAANIYTVAFATMMDDKVCHSAPQAGATLGVRVAACITALPSTGGTIDSRGEEGAQSILTNIFSGVTKPITWILGGGTYTTVPVITPANFTLIMQPSTLIKAATGFGVNDRLITILGKDNVRIYGNGGTVQMLKASYSGEQRHGVYIASSTNVSVQDIFSIDSGGDGFYLGAGDATQTVPSENVSLINVVADNNRRQGLSIVTCRHCTVLNSTFKNTSGTDPQQGIDIESNAATDYLEDIVIRNVRTSGNVGGGILIAPTELAGARDHPVTITIDGWVSYQDGTSAGDYPAGLTLASPGVTPVTTYNIAGFVTVKNAVIQEPWAFGMIAVRWVSSNPYAKLENVVVLNPNRGQAAVIDVGLSGGQNTNASNSGFVVASVNSTLTTAQTAHIDFIDCAAIDGRASPSQVIGFYAISDNVAKISNLTFRNPKAVSGAMNAANVVNWTNGAGTVIYDTPPTSAPVASASIGGYHGYVIAPTASGVYTLDLTASNVVGTEIAFRNDGNYTLQIRPATGDTILFPGSVANADYVSRYTGDYIKLRAVGGTSWLIVNQEGSFQRCASAASPAVCGNSAKGSVTMAAAGTTITVNTTAVIADSQIFIQEDSSLGTLLGVTCNTVLSRNYTVTARTTSTSFVITSDAAPAANPACLNYFISD